MDLHSFLCLNIAWFLILDAAQPNFFFLIISKIPISVGVAADQGTDVVRTTICFHSKNPSNVIKPIANGPLANNHN